MRTICTGVRRLPWRSVFARVRQGIVKGKVVDEKNQPLPTQGHITGQRVTPRRRRTTRASTSRLVCSPARNHHCDKTNWSGPESQRDAGTPAEANMTLVPAAQSV